jgi:hypothetical protein
MRTRRDWIIVATVAALVAVGIVLAGTLVPGTTGKAGAASLATPSPTPAASPVLTVERNGVVAKSYTLDQVEAFTPFAGFAGYAGKSAHGPDAVTASKLTDVATDALGTPITAVESVVVAEVDATPYTQTFTGAQLLDPLSGFTMSDATTLAPIAPADLTGPLAAVLVYSDPLLNVMPVANGPLRFFIADATSENAVMSGKYSVSCANVINVTDPITMTLKAKPASLKVGKTIVFSGKVTNAVANDSIVKLRLVVGKRRFILERTGKIGSTGAFKLTYKVTKHGRWTFTVTYKAGKTFKTSNVTVTVRK